MKLKQLAVFLLILLLGSLMPAAAQRGNSIELKKHTVEDYVKAYAPMAVSEMHRARIPASITLAQGILESNFGNSALAREANNHFGIKCHKEWGGKTYHMDDDEADECFRVYAHAEESYRDHSDFLTSRERYASLFELDPKDYKSWAKGLKKAGYATNPQYAELLIRIIEERNLHQYDLAEKEEPQQVAMSKEDLLKSLDAQIFTFNGRKTVVSQPGETLEDISNKYKVPRKRLYNVNNMVEGQELLEGSKVYLEPKSTLGFEETYVVRKGETMHSISQKQGMKLASLYKKNRMEFGQEPAVGETLCLRRKCKDAPRLKSEAEIKWMMQEKIEADLQQLREEEKKAAREKLAAEAPAQKEVERLVQSVRAPQEAEPQPVKEEIVRREEVKQSNPPPVTEKVDRTPPPRQEITLPSKQEKIDPIQQSTNQPPVPNVPMKAKIHLVERGETLFSISQHYGVSVDDIRRWNNNIIGNSLNVGDRLTIYVIEGARSKTDTQPPVTPAPVPQNSTPEKSAYHTVAPGETLFSIARQYELSIQELMQLNNLTSNALSVGQQLVVKKGAKEKPVENKPETISEPQKHVVQVGETLYSISRKYNVSIEDLRSWNKLTSNELSVGQQIIIKP